MENDQTVHFRSVSTIERLPSREAYALYVFSVLLNFEENRMWKDENLDNIRFGMCFFFILLLCHAWAIEDHRIECEKDRWEWKVVLWNKTAWLSSI